METLDQIKSRIEAAVNGAQVTVIANESPSGQTSLLIDDDHAFAVAKFLRDDAMLALDYCSNVTGVDWPEAELTEKIKVNDVEGNPIEIMDLSFATQLAALAHLLEARPGIGVFALPPESVDRVAQAALRSRGLTANPATASGRGEDDWRSLRYR